MQSDTAQITIRIRFCVVSCPLHFFYLFNPIAIGFIFHQPKCSEARCIWIKNLNILMLIKTAFTVPTALPPTKTIRMKIFHIPILWPVTNYYIFPQLFQRKIFLITNQFCQYQRTENILFLHRQNLGSTYDEYLQVKGDYCHR